MKLTIGDLYTNVVCESFKDDETGRIRVRPVDIKIPEYKLVIECSKQEREAHPIGTKFLVIEAKVCKKKTKIINIPFVIYVIYP